MKGLSKVALGIVAATLISACSKQTVDDHLLAARQFAEAQNNQAAIIEYKNAIQLDPKSPLARFELGELYLRQNNYAAAEKELNRALELGHPAADVIPLLSLAYKNTGAENALADVDHKTAGMTAVQAAEVGFYKIQALAQLEKKEQALVLIEEIEALDTSSVYKGLATSLRAVLDNNLDDALAQTELLKQQAPLNKDVLQQLARLQLATQKTEAAIETFVDYLKTFPDDIETKFVLAALLVENKKLDQALPYVDQLLALSADNGMLNQYKGIIESARNNHQLALTHLETAIKNGRDEPVVRLVAGFSAYNIRDFESAARHLEMVASRLPDNHPGLRMLADSMLQIGQSQDASDILARIDGSMEKDATLFSKAGFQLLKDGHISQARSMVERSEDVSVSADDLTRLGILQLSLNNVDGFVNLESAVDKAPDSQASNYTLLRAYLLSKQTDKAGKLLTRLLEQSPNDAQLVMFNANLDFLQKNFASANQKLDKALELGFDKAQVALTKAQLALAQEDKAAAKNSVEQALTVEPSNTEALFFLFALEDEKLGKQAVIDKITKQLQRDSNNEALRVLQARMLGAVEDFAAALQVLAPIDEPDADTPRQFWPIKGALLSRVGQIRDAELHYDAWLKLFPEDKNALIGRLFIADRKGEYTKATELANEFLKTNNDIQVNILSAHFNALIGKTEAAKKTLSLLNEKAQSIPFIRGIKARIAYNEKRYQEGLADAEAAYAQSATTNNMLLVAATLEALGDKDKATEFLNQHVSNNPNDIAASVLLAERVIGSDQAKAEALYEQIIKVHDSNLVALNNLAYLYSSDKRYAEALPLAQRAVEIQRDNADAIDTLAQILVGLNKPKEALEQYQTIASRDDLNEEIYVNYAELLLAQGNKERALRALDREFKRSNISQRAAALKASIN